LPRVLVVDEQANQARVMAIGLRVEGFDVETAASSAEALERLAAQAFEIAMVDLMLPGTNGIQLARLVRERHPATRVVLMSAYHLSERQLARADCGAAGFVPKPLDLGELATFLRAKVQGGVPGGAPFDVPGDGLTGGRPRAVAGAAAPR
jgi:DNA-binding response OmpR family regulator